MHRRAVAAGLVRLLVPLVLLFGAAGVAAPSASAIGVPVVIDGFGSSTAAASPFTRTVTALPLPGTSITPAGTFSASNGLATMTMSGSGNGTAGTQLDYAPTSGGSVDLTGSGNNTQVLVSFGLVNQVPAPGQFATGVTVFMTAIDSAGGKATEPSDAVGNYYAFNAAFPFTGPGGFQCANTICSSTEGGSLDFTHITHFSITFEYPSSGSGGGSLTVQVERLWATPTGGAPPSAPSPTVSAPATAVAPPGGAVDFTVSFSDDQGAAPVTYNPPSNTGLRAQDLTVGGSAFTGGTPSLTVTGGPSTYTVAVSGMTQDGGITLDVPAGVVDDAWGQLNTASANDPTAAFTFAIPPTFTSGTQASFVVTQPGSFTVTATGNPASALSITHGSLPSGLSFTDNGNGTATIAGTPVLGQTGTYSLTLGANNIGGTASQSLTLTVNKVDQTALAVTSTSGTFGTALTLATSGGSGTGAVTYAATAGTASGCSVSAGTLTSTSAGTCRVTATKAGDANYNATTSPQTTVTFAKADQAALTVTSTSGTFGTALTLATSGGSGAGAVGYGVVDGTASGCSQSAGVLTVTGAGTCLVTATKASDSNYKAVSSPQTTVTFGKAMQSITFTSQAPTGVPGAKYTVAATASSGLPVSFTIDPSGGTGVCSLSGAVVTFTAAGSCVIDANQAGSGNYLAAPQIRQTVTVKPSGLGGTSGGNTGGTSGGNTGGTADNHFVRPPRYTPHKDGTFSVTVKVPGPGTVEIMVTAWTANLVHAARAASVLQPALGRFVFARAHATAKHAGTLRILVTPNARGRLFFARHTSKARVRLWVTFTPTRGGPRSVGYYGILLP